MAQRAGWHRRWSMKRLSPPDLVLWFSLLRWRQWRFETIYGQRATPASQELYLFSAIKRSEVCNPQVKLLCKRLEILESAQMDVRRVVPLVGHFAGDRHAATQNRESVRPIPKIGKGHNTEPRHPRHFREYVLGVMHGLQGLRQHHGIKLLVVEQRQAFLKILLDDPDALTYGTDHSGIVELDPCAVHVFMITQVGQQGPVATPQVKDPAAVIDPVCNARQVRPQRVPDRFTRGRRRFRDGYLRLTHASTPVTDLRCGRPSSAAIRS